MQHSDMLSNHGFKLEMACTKISTLSKEEYEYDSYKLKLTFCLCLRVQVNLYIWIQCSFKIISEIWMSPGLMNACHYS